MASTQISNTEIFGFSPALVFKLSAISTYMLSFFRLYIE